MNRNNLVLGGMLGIALAMVGASFAAVPLYKVFCAATGVGGTTQRAAAGADHTVDRKIEIRFVAEVNSELPWSFKPNQRSVTLKVGETGMASFRAQNLSTVPIVGTAVFNVTPAKVGLYFDKIQCFCFTQQALRPQETADLPVAFFVDPKIVDDHTLDDVKVITLSYTFYKARSQAFDKAASAGESDAAPAANKPAPASRSASALAVPPRVE